MDPALINPVTPMQAIQAFQHEILSRPVFRYATRSLVLVLGAVLAVLVYSWSARQGYEQLNDVLGHQLDLYAGALESELGRHEYFPGIVAMDRDVQALLADPGDARQRERTSKHLASLNVRAGAMVIFVVGRDGRIAASSDWYQPDSAIGHDVSGQAYVNEALQGQPARHFSRSAGRNAPEYYFAQPVLRDGVVTGVAVVKISLDPIESTWTASVSQTNSEILLVMDENDVILIGTQPAWRNLSAAAMVRAMSVEGGGIISLRSQAPNAPMIQYGTQVRQMPHQGWRIAILANAGNVTVNALRNAVGTAILLAFVGLLGLFLAQRRRAIASQLKARAALQRAHDELEVRIAARTAELHDMNQELLREISERKHAEQVLRASQDSLIHASRLALLGQMSAGITHEISQPLTALRSLSYNSQLLLKRGEMARIEKNLQSISGLTERLGHLTDQLKSFSRKTPLTLRPMLLADAVSATLLLLENRIRTEHITVDSDVDASLRALCDANRLEQVLINLCANALDAMRDAPAKTLAIRVWRADGRAHVRVADSGTGIPEEALARLFEPFFSTKLPGQGLGLGLAISADIVRDFGGTLRATNIPGGAAFELDLQIAEEYSHV
ncbi:sensor histidine kinase [Pseudoduganella ginsengisoli]|uniref:C4-dicarboxylate transport sensor protein DctB n=1 Tax=Pseudoduganella ginsengisoli TaxID=1462440 RepID=A0A6L6Q418_9BURK|nr:ATP-binding protein [Pseudoduganella ginsengisoli]MTW03802.1 sensor histidine kinase [Pseudoduganella ginsengisoli]